MIKGIYNYFDLPLELQKTYKHMRNEFEALEFYEVNQPTHKYLAKLFYKAAGIVVCHRIDIGEDRWNELFEPEPNDMVLTIYEV